MQDEYWVYLLPNLIVETMVDAQKFLVPVCQNLVAQLSSSTEKLVALKDERKQTFEMMNCSFELKT